MNLIPADRKALIVVLVDLQPQFIDTSSSNDEAVIGRIQQLLLMCDTLNIPVLATVEEPIAQKGSLVNSLAKWFPKSGIVFSKLAYDLTAETDIRNALLKSNRKQVAVVGAETDVCVMQSVLGLLRMGLDVFLMEDCVMSSTTDTSAALARMYACGAIPSTWKSLYYELIRTDDEDNRLREDPNMMRKGFIPPEKLPSNRSG